MGVHVLAGDADGTQHAAAMYDSVTNQMFGPLFVGADAEEQIDAFLAWMRLQPWLLHAVEMEIGADDIPNPLRGAHTSDPRAWPASGLRKLYRYWRERFVDTESNTLD